jgi:hypothetical protein
MQTPNASSMTYISRKILLHYNDEVFTVFIFFSRTYFLIGLRNIRYCNIGTENHILLVFMGADLSTLTVF